MNATGANLFSPVQLGSCTLQRCVVVAPPTRSRSAQPGHVPGDLTFGSCRQPASEGGFIILKAAAILMMARGSYGAFCIDAKEPVADARNHSTAGNIALLANGAEQRVSLWLGAASKFRPPSQQQ
jgi:2,4-dienoyl-CoA reductase-like NADH-dependent reductase (Old Yellow Enzyme family)